MDRNNDNLQDELERNQMEREEFLGERVKAIRELTIEMNEYLKREDGNELRETNRLFSQNNPLLDRVINSISRIDVSAGGCIYLLLALVCMAVLLILYFLK